MFRLDMKSIRQSAEKQWLTANLAKPANRPQREPKEGVHEGEISQEPPKLARLAGIAISHGVSQESAELRMARLIAAAMRVCDHYGDSDKARAEMRADCLALDQAQQADLLAHFRQSYPGIRPKGST